MGNFVWNEFGLLKEVSKSSNMVFIKNDQGATRQMSITKYEDSALAVYEKALSLKGKNIRIRTSQNTNNWSTGVWFSELEPSTQNYSKSDFLTIGESQPEPDVPF